MLASATAGDVGVAIVIILGCIAVALIICITTFLHYQGEREAKERSE